MPTPPSLSAWQPKLGIQRDWVWRGWRVRYTYLRPLEAIAPAHSVNTSNQTVPILLLHGFGAALTQWHGNLVPLSQQQPVYALDMLGFGASEKASADYKVKLWAEQVRDFCHQVVGQPVMLVGHSLGALVALTLAVTYPEQVRGLVLITLPASRQELLPKWSQPIVGRVESLFSPALLIRLIFQLARRPGFIRSALRKIYINPDYVTDDLVSSFVLPTFDRGAGKVLARLVKARTQNDFSASTHALMRHLQLPVLLLWGESDRIIPIAWGRELVTTYKNLKMVEVPSAGHCPYDECAEQVNREIAAWIKTVIQAESE